MAERELKKIARSRKPIIAGPWLTEVGYEVLYWLPFLNWATSELGIGRDRMTVISRGGAAPWYGNLGGSYIDVFDFLTPDEFRAKNQRYTQRGTLGQKQTFIHGFDKEVIRLAAASRGMKEYELLHPSLMYRLFGFFWPYLRTESLVPMYSKYQQLPAVDADGLPGELPGDYVAVKFYFTSCFPDTEYNRTFIRELLRNLSRSTNVVLLDTGLNIDDHVDCPVDAAGRIYSARSLMNPRNNLDVQTRIVSRARAFIGTYGGFSYLASFYGVPSIAFYSIWNFRPDHVNVAYHAFSTFNSGSYVMLNTKDVRTADFLAGMTI
jgi:hypothetical protein